MGNALSECRLFFREFVQNFHTTGAILPSGRFLAKALSRFVAQPGDGPRRILEVGPGTGAVTRKIVAALRPDDHLDLVELNDHFVECLKQRFQKETPFRAVADRTRILHCPVEELPPDSSYQVIVSGLPLNNFAVDDVVRILTVLRHLLQPGGTLSFFEYIAVRRLKAAVSGRAERDRLRRIGQVVDAILRDHEVYRDSVWINVPPAWVHHVRFGE